MKNVTYNDYRTLSLNYIAAVLPYLSDKRNVSYLKRTMNMTNKELKYYLTIPLKGERLDIAVYDEMLRKLEEKGNTR